MGAPFLQPPTASRIAHWSPALIAIGLAALLIAMVWPAVPMVTALALVALGATGLTVARFRGRASAAAVLLFHLAIYGVIYVLAVGAVLHAATRGNSAIGLPTAIDLAASLWPAVAAARLVGEELLDARSQA